MASYEFGPYRLDARTRVLSREGRPIALPPKSIEDAAATWTPRECEPGDFRKFKLPAALLQYDFRHRMLVRRGLRRVDMARGRRKARPLAPGTGKANLARISTIRSCR